MFVKNINGTSDSKRNCNCTSWSEHWENYAGENLIRCKVKDCENPVDDGAHVQKYGSKDRSWYIVPFCRTHNHAHDQAIELKPNTVLAPITKQDTCES